MSRTSSMSRVVTSIINGQPKLDLGSVNIRIPIVSGSKRTRNGKNHGPSNALVDYCDSEEYEVQGKEYETMEPKETTHLLCGESVYEALRFNGSKERQEDTESMSDDFRYYAINPVCMNVRICVFWFLWAILILVLVISIISYCSFAPKMSCDSDKLSTSNATSS